MEPDEAAVVAPHPLRCQGLFLTNNATFIAIKGLVALSLAPSPWMAMLSVTGDVAGGVLCAGLGGATQAGSGPPSCRSGSVAALLSSGFAC